MGWSSGAKSGESPRRVRRRRRRTGLELRERIGAGLLVLAVAGSALAFGAQHPEVLLPIALASAASAALLSPGSLPRGVWLLAGLTLYCFLQLVPLPFALLERLSPNAAGIWRGSLPPFGTSAPRFASLSVDPAGTALEAVKYAGYACILAAATGFRSRHRAFYLSLLVFGSALLVAVVTLVHGLLDLELIYGHFRPREATRWLRGPFVNGNNLSGYLNLGLYAGAGLALARRSEKLLIPGVVVLAAGSLLAGSRAGTISLFLGVPLLVFFVLRQRHDSLGKVAFVTGTVSAVGFAVAAAVSGRRLFAVFGDTEVHGKVSVWRWTLDLIRDFPVFGVGRGAFEGAFQSYRRPLGMDFMTVFTHAENFPLQWAADFGLPVALLTVVMLAAIGRRAFRRATRDPAAAGLVTGLGVLTLQNLADLGLEIFAVVAAALVAFAAAKDPVSTSKPRSARTYLPEGLVVLAVAVAVALHAAPLQVERARIKTAFAEFSRAPRAHAREFRAHVHRAVARHPGDSYLALVGALGEIRLGQDPLPWLGRALERAPLDGNAHLVLSDVLFRKGARTQSLLHARLAALYDTTLRDQALTRIATRATSVSDLLSALPDHLPGAWLLGATCAKLGGELAVGCWREELARGSTPDAARALAVALLDALERKAPPCAADANTCQAEAARLLDGLEAKDAAKDWRVAELRSRFVALRGDPRQAALLLLDHCPGGSDAVECCERALDFALRSGNTRTLDVVATRYTAVVCGDPAACASLHERIGRSASNLGAGPLALRHFLDAAKVGPTGERWLLAAETAASLGSRMTAELAIERAGREPELADEQHRRIAHVHELLSPAPAPEP